MDGSDRSRDFHHGDSQSPVLETSDFPMFEIPMSQRLLRDFTSVVHEGLTPVHLSTDLTAVKYLDQDPTDQIRPSCTLSYCFPDVENKRPSSLFSSRSDGSYAPPELVCVLPRLRRISIAKCLDLAFFPLPSHQLESRLRSQKRYSS